MNDWKAMLELSKIKAPRTPYRAQLRLPKGYLRAVAIMLALWLGGLVALKWGLAASGREMKDMTDLIQHGCFWIVLGLSLLFAAHTLIICMLEFGRELRDKAAYEQWSEDELRSTYALLIQGVGLGIHGSDVRQLWESLHNGQPLGAFATPLSQPDDRPGQRLYRNRGAAFRTAAAHGVTFWPIPTFVVGSARPEHDPVSPAWMINEGRNAALLGQHMFVAEFADRGDRMQRTIRELFRFMDDQGQVPQALLIGDDEGIATQDGATVKANTTAVLFGDIQRMSRLQNFEVDTPTPQAFASSPTGRLWTHFWQSDKAYAAEYRFDRRWLQKHDLTIPRTMTSYYWRELLQPLMRDFKDDGPGYFQPSTWLPARWATFQFSTFVHAPRLGYLHRSIIAWTHRCAADAAVSAHNVAELKYAWINAVNTLRHVECPTRVFYDSTRRPDIKATLTQVWEELDHEDCGLTPCSPGQTYDVGPLIGDTGVSHILLMISLATAAGYEQGGISAVVYEGAEHSTIVQLIRPVCDAFKEENLRHGHLDPFSARGTGEPS